MSPTLFIIFSDILSRMLARAEDQGKLNGVKVSRTSPKITHLMYVEDFVIYCQAKDQEVAVIKDILNQYYSWTRQAIKFGK